FPAITNEDARTLMSNSVLELEQELDEFRSFMNKVETGKIEVFQNNGFNKGVWMSYVKQQGWNLMAAYLGPDGLVDVFEKRINQEPFPLVYGFDFYPDGRLHSVD